MNSSYALVTLFIAWNLFTFGVMGIDKYKAKNNRQRISEKSLFAYAFLLGAIGIICGMCLFRHKTKHWSFKILVPTATIINIVLGYYIFQLISGR